MNMQAAFTTAIVRGRSIVLALIVAASFSTLLPSGLLAAESSPVPEATASLEATLAPAEAACQSAADLRLIVGFLEDSDPSVDGWVPVVVGVIAGLSEARQLAGFVGETYRPLVEDLIISFEGLRTTLDEVGGEATAGAQLAAVGEAITAIGDAMDVLSVQLQTGCPADE